MMMGRWAAAGRARPPQRNAETVVERQVVRHRGLEVALERGLQDVIRELRMSGDLLEGQSFIHGSAGPSCSSPMPTQMLGRLSMKKFTQWSGAISISTSGLAP